MTNHGWVDLQVNGHRVVDYSDPELTRDMVLRSIEELLATGTDVFLPTIITGDLGRNVRNALLIREVCTREARLTENGLTLCEIG